MNKMKKEDQDITKKNDNTIESPKDNKENSKNQNPNSNLEKETLDKKLEEQNIIESQENDEITDISDEEIEKLRDEKLRLLAEMENLRKRSEKDRLDAVKYGSINLARDILSFDDNLSRALEAIPEQEKKSEEINNLIDGLQMIQKDFVTTLEKYGVKKIEALNKKFDHNFHQAMVEIEDEKNDEGMVIQEIQTGYTMHERLLRPSMVGVSKKPVNAESEEKN